MDRLLVVDRLEGEMALCLDEAKNQTILPLADLPPGVKEGDWLRQTRRLDGRRPGDPAPQRKTESCFNGC